MDDKVKEIITRCRPYVIIMARWEEGMQNWGGIVLHGSKYSKYEGERGAG